MMPTMVKEHKRKQRNTTVGRKTFELYRPNRNTIQLNKTSMVSIKEGGGSPRTSSVALKSSPRSRKRKEPLVSNEYQMKFNPMEDTDGLITKNFEYLEAYGASSVEPKKK